ncbi:MAG: hypothetical protein N4A70_20970 [Pelagimonas sp.]|jgi:hypothetical protein|nr:hypothetical protein [Pelagimonas sp.]
MTTLSLTFNRLVSPMTHMVLSLRALINRDPVPCWTEYLREENNKR